MRRCLLAIFFFCAPIGSWGADREPWEQAEALFQAGEFAKGRLLLVRALGDGGISAVHQARVLDAFARFHERHAGDYDQAVRIYRRIAALGLAPDHPRVAEALGNVVRIQALDARYEKENRLLQRARIFTSDRDEIESRVDELRRLIEERPDYHRLADAYFHIGNFLLTLDRPHPTLRLRRQAYESLSRALELRPGLAFHLPVSHQKDVAFRTWMQLVLKRSAWTILGAILFVAMVSFYASRPWNWLGARHLLVPAAIALLWWIALFASAGWMASRLDLSADQPPVYASAEAGSPGSEVLVRLFFHGLAGVFGVFAVAASTARFRMRWSWSLVNASTGILLFSSLAALFYLNYCAPGADFQFPGERRFAYLKGNFRFVGYQTMTPYVLTNPKAYPNLEISNIEEPEFRKWVMEHSPGVDIQEGVNP